ncbi:magnesium transporter [Cerasibacillus sp. JNUCC 74]
MESNKYDKKYEEQYEQHWQKLQQALEQDNMEGFRNEFLDMHPYDQAMFFMEQTKAARLKIYTYLSPEEVGNIIEIMDDEKQRRALISEMDPRFASMVLAKMFADNAVDILSGMDKDQIASFLTIMNQEAAKEIKKLLHYEEKTAGSIMTTEYVATYKTNTVQQTMQQLKEQAPDAETIYYMYVLDDEKRLVGVLSLRDLIVADEDTLIEDVMIEKVVAVSVGKDQEEVAQMMRDYDFLALPVVDFQGHLLGIITVDDILDVMEEEASDDYSKLAGVSDMDKPSDTAVVSVRKRLPWLVILLFLGMLTASLIGRFEETLNQVSVLAIFIPLIAGMAGNSGTQALAVAVRGMANGDYDKQGKARLVLREGATGIINGIICGIVIMIVIYIWKGKFYLGLLVGISIAATLFVATLAGVLVPMLMERIKIDPAVASGPFITTINDIISILIYFSMATVFMKFLL